jgi:hypothetical protein
MPPEPDDAARDEPREAEHPPGPRAGGQRPVAHVLSALSVAVAERVQVQLGAADGVSVVVRLGDTFVFGGSNPFTDTIDRVQHELMEGPCLTSMAIGDVVDTRTIGAGEPRWPDFTAHTAALALRGVRSTPLFANGQVIGSLNLYAKVPGRLDAVDPAVFARTIRETESSLSSAWLVAIADRNRQWLARALDARAEVARAVGLLMVRDRTSAAEARALISARAREDGVDEATAARRLTKPDGAPG